MSQSAEILLSHSTDGVVPEYYLDPKKLNLIEKEGIEIKIFE